VSKSRWKSDGYSRYIIYLTVSTDKKAETVKEIFIAACNYVGWASRVRWDRGTKNTLAALAQTDYWWDDTKPLAWNQRRGSALTGRSVQNCRAEYMWCFVKKHVTGAFRKLFFRMERELHVLNSHDPHDLFCLQAVGCAPVPPPPPAPPPSLPLKCPLFSVSGLSFSHTAGM
jgi:hypothetical protein